ncbi:MAG TPA: PQQ-dependent sugar dehydrogenase [Candidatus Bilamarchaeum sp.]|nr:PQQ-dependent sugar dehydrogenase [Candidatus Bilamarchaeum sp.]
MRLLAVLAVLAALYGCISSNPNPSPNVNVTVIAENLEIPWAMDFLPDGSMIFTERPGRIRIIEGGALLPEPAATLKVATTGESGLLGIAVDPDYGANHFIYVYYTYFADPENKTMRNRVSRFRLDNNKASGESILIDGIPGGLGDQGFHNGGRIKFGPDGKLYITTGDGGVTGNAQSLSSLGGKILRINKDGSVPEDNPFPGSAVYSLGHRNPQGLAWHPGTGKLFATEHGPVGNDELNQIIPGKNYLWPDKQCTDEADPSVLCFTDTIAPSGAAFYGNRLYIAGLRGTQVREVAFDDNASAVASQQTFLVGYGRIRDVVIRDDKMYILTSNRDGRSVLSASLPAGNDDRILMVDLAR